MVDETPAGEVETLESKNARLGVDTQFDQQKHAYVLTFPWNFPEIVSSFEAKHRALGGYWGNYVSASCAEHDFNILFREFHQFCAIPDHTGISRICEGKLAEAVNQSV